MKIKCIFLIIICLNLTNFSIYSESLNKNDSLAIATFEYPPDLEETWQNLIYETFLNSMVQRNTAGIRILERSRIQALFSEKKLQLAGITDEAGASEFGGLIGASHVLIGKTIYSGSDQKSLNFFIRIVNVNDSTILFSEQVESTLDSGSLRYTIGVICDSFFGTSMDKLSEDVVFNPVLTVKIPPLPPADTDVNIIVEDFKVLQNKISELSKNNKYSDALKALSDLNKLILDSKSNSYFMNNPADKFFINEMEIWHKNVHAELKRIEMDIEIADAIALISGKRDVYKRMMQDHVSPDDEKARNLRWTDIFDIIKLYNNTERVLKSDVVSEAYNRVFHLDMGEDLANYNTRLKNEQQKTKESRENQDHAWNEFWDTIFPMDLSVYPDDSFSFHMGFSVTYPWGAGIHDGLRINYMWVFPELRTGIGIGVSLYDAYFLDYVDNGSLDFNNFKSGFGTLLPVKLFIPLYLYPDKDIRNDLIFSVGINWLSGITYQGENRESSESGIIWDFTLEQQIRLFRDDTSGGGGEAGWFYLRPFLKWVYSGGYSDIQDGATTDYEPAGLLFGGIAFVLSS